MIEYYVLLAFMFVSAAVLSVRLSKNPASTPATLGDLGLVASFLGLTIVAYAEKILFAIEAAQTAAAN